jgi:hypothetical protein
VSELLTVTCTAVGGCRGVVTLGTFAGTNPSSAGSKTIVIGGTSDYGASTPADDFLIPIIDSDQVTVNAHIDSSMVFDIDTTISESNAWTEGQTPGTGHETASPYSVDLGTLTSSSVSTSGLNSIPYIYLDLSHNATGGAVVTVKSANAGLASVSVPADEIVSTSGNYVAGVEHYGLCIEQSWDNGAPGASNTKFLHDDVFGAAASTVNTTACDNVDGVDTDMGALTGATQNILTTTNAVFQAVAKINVKAAISTVTPAHPDYADTLTFIATATF